LGQIRFPDENKFIIKLDCWHLAFFEQINAWYPHTPKIVLMREPKASITSHLNHAGMQAIPNLLEPELFGLHQTQVAHMDQMEYLNHVFTAMYTQIQAILLKYPDVLLLNYDDGVEHMIEQLLHLLALKPDAAVQQRLLARLQYHSKKGVEPFQENKAMDVPVIAACSMAYENLRCKTYQRRSKIEQK
jgi:hypothetical protein